MAKSILSIIGSFYAEREQRKQLEQFAKSGLSMDMPEFYSVIGSKSDEERSQILDIYDSINPSSPEEQFNLSVRKLMTLSDNILHLKATENINNVVEREKAQEAYMIEEDRMVMSFKKMLPDKQFDALVYISFVQQTQRSTDNYNEQGCYGNTPCDNNHFLRDSDFSFLDQKISPQSRNPFEEMMSHYAMSKCISSEELKESITQERRELVTRNWGKPNDVPSNSHSRRH